MVATRITELSDLHQAAAGCSMIKDRMAAASPRQFFLGMVVLFVPGLLIVILISGGFASERFRKHPFISSAAIILALLLPLEIHLLPPSALSMSQPEYKKLISKNLYDMLILVYGDSDMPPAQDLPGPNAAMALGAAALLVEDKRKKLRLPLTMNDAQAQTTLVDETLYFHRDHLGSPRVITKSDGSIWKRTQYLPFGEFFRETMIFNFNLPGFANPKVSYTGQERDESTGLYYYGARFYDAGIGRFISADNIANFTKPQSINRYAYTLNNPLSNVDPSGNITLGEAGYGYVTFGPGYFGFGFQYPMVNY